MKQIRNEKLYNDIMTYYINSENPVSQQDIATHFKMSIGSIKNFMFRHNLNKKNYYAKTKEKVKDYYQKGLTTKEIAKILDCTTQHVYFMGKEGK